MQSEKNALRRYARKILAEMTGEEKRKESDLIISRLRELEKFKSAERILLYYPMDDEVDVRVLFEDERVLFPFIDEDVMDYARPPLKKGMFGIPEPVWKHPVTFDNAILIAPALAFSPLRYRLGRGMGYYDRYIRRMRGKIYAVGLVYERTYGIDIPASPYDEEFDMVITSDLQGIH